MPIEEFMRQRFFILLFSFLILSTSIISRVNEAVLKINITNLRNDKGYVLLALYKEGVGYPDHPEKSFKRVKLSITNKTASVSFTALPSDNYSIAILHDENDDQKMNTNFIGLPKEGYGFSNNVMGTFGPPSLSKASFYFTANESKELTIRTRY